ncbi:MAG: HAD hydrolase-like protein [Verrucomicrobiales bacterium]|nr:HAD hydrolase-like protein [Verrucomicrobiales bacterium]
MSSPDQPKLLLFDIDGTLLDTGGVGLRSLKEAFLETFDLSHREPEFPRLDLAGSTDGSIVDHIFGLFEIEPTGENREAYFSSYHDRLSKLLVTFSNDHGRRLPGVLELLTRLRDETDHVLGLLTGNIARGAFTKVDHFEMGGFFEFGAFGDDHPDRNQLGPIAIDRAVDHSGHEFPANQVFIIGDTPKDVACARACGAKAVTVATGGFPKAELDALNPCFSFSDLETDHHSFFAMLG